MFTWLKMQSYLTCNLWKVCKNPYFSDFDSTKSQYWIHRCTKDGGFIPNEEISSDVCFLCNWILNDLESWKISSEGTVNQVTLIGPHRMKCVVFDLSVRSPGITIGNREFTFDDLTHTEEKLLRRVIWNNVFKRKHDEMERRRKECNKQFITEVNSLKNG